MGPWYPVTPVELAPSLSGGDTPGVIALVALVPPPAEERAVERAQRKGILR